MKRLPPVLVLLFIVSTSYSAVAETPVPAPNPAPVPATCAVGLEVWSTEVCGACADTACQGKKTGKSCETTIHDEGKKVTKKGKCENGPWSTCFQYNRAYTGPCGQYCACKLGSVGMDEVEEWNN